MTVEIRPATPADIDAYAVEQSPYRVRAYTALVNGRIIGLGGVAYLPNGAVMAFLNINEDARSYPVTLCKVAVRVIREAHERGVKTINAVCDDKIEAAPRFLRRLGFKHLGEDIYQHEAG